MRPLKTSWKGFFLSGKWSKLGRRSSAPDLTPLVTNSLHSLDMILPKDRLSIFAISVGAIDSFGFTDYLPFRHQISSSVQTLFTYISVLFIPIPLALALTDADYMPISPCFAKNSLVDGKFNAFFSRILMQITISLRFLNVKGEKPYFPFQDEVKSEK